MNLSIENTTTTVGDVTSGVGDTATIEVQDISVKALFICVACISMSSSSVALAAMWKTKQTPYAAKLLATGLMTFDALYIVTSSARKFITNTAVNVTTMAIVTTLSYLAFITVGMMAVERFIVIIKPMYYLNHFSKRKVNIVVFSIWNIILAACLFVRFGVCYFLNRTIDVYTTAAVCNKLMSFYYTSIIMIILIVASICYIRIGLALRTHVHELHSTRACALTKKQRMTAHKLKTTSLSFAYLIVIYISSAAYIVIVALVNTTGLKYSSLRLSMEVVTLFNCIMDPFLYVLWFKESRFVILRFLSRFYSPLQPRVDRMKIEVYNIVISKSKSGFECG